MVSISDDILSAVPISEAELRLEIAIMLYQKGLPPGKAASVAGMDRPSFRHLLASRQIPVSYDVEDLEQDVRTLRELFSEDAAGSNAP
jgi:predicted HTH domain antitoxin